VTLCCNRCFVSVAGDEGIKFAKLAESQAISGVRHWFVGQELERRRKMELECEVWSHMLLNTRDASGRTALHVAVGNSKMSTPAIEALICGGRGRFDADVKNDQSLVGPHSPSRHQQQTHLLTSTRERPLSPQRSKYGEHIHQPLFNKHTLYELATGRQVVAMLNKNYHHAHHRPDASSDGYRQRLMLLSAGWDQLSKSPGKLHDSADFADKSGAGNRRNLFKDTLHPQKQFDFEIIIPWSVRCMIRCAADIAGVCDPTASKQQEKNRSDEEPAHEGATDSHNERKTSVGWQQSLQVLRQILKAADNFGSGLLLLPELRSALFRLGVRLNDTVLRELCRRYAGKRNNGQKVLDKWKRLRKGLRNILVVVFWQRCEKRCLYCCQRLKTKSCFGQKKSLAVFEPSSSSSDSI
jgi:hypothetical protein